MRLESGAQLGPYRIDSLLGVGGMGEVYAGFDTRLGRNVAIKLLSNRSASDDQVRRFKQEACAAGILNHPNILTVYDVGGERDTLFIVSELLQGMTLRALMEKEHPLSIRKTIDYGVQIARGLDAAHVAKIVHRDLKPDNVFVTREGRVKVFDFGIAKLHVANSLPIPPDDPTRRVDETAAGIIIGTVHYMSPEQVNGDSIDQRSDIFSFGVVLYEMLCGRWPFHGRSPHDTIHAIVHDDPQPPSTIRGDIPRALETIVLSCLAKDPNERFQSAADLAIALQTVAWPTSPRPDPSPPRRTGWMAAVVAVATIAVTASVTALMLWMRQPAKVSFRQLTFQRGSMFGARFALRGSAIVYSAAWDDAAPDVYFSTLNNPFSRRLGLPNAAIEAVLPSDEVIVLTGGTLARAPLVGGSPNKVADDVVAADAKPDGHVVIAHRLNGRIRVESPIGTPLYETDWIVPDSLRVSPDGQWIAFFERSAGGSRAYSYDLVAIDAGGRKHMLAADWSMVQSPAWTPDGRELWFTASHTTDKATELYAVTTSGRLRFLSSFPVPMAIDDVSQSGALLNSFDERFETVAVSSAGEKSLSLAMTNLSDLSHDGKIALLDDELWGVHHTYIRSTDGGQPVPLSAGIALSLSPDATNVIAMTDEARQNLLLIRTDTGQPRPLPLGALEAASWSAAWFPDAKRIAFEGHVHGGRPRIYEQRIGDGRITALSPEDVTLATRRGVSPDGMWILVHTGDGVPHLLSVADHSLREAKGLLPTDVPMQWSHDGRDVFVLAERNTCPAKIFRVNPLTGERTLWREIAPSNRAGVHYVERVRISDDEKTYVFSFTRSLGDLYLVTGLR